MDATGVGDAFVEQLHRTTNSQGTPLRIEGFKIASNLIKRNLVEKLGTYIENSYITFPNIPELIDELQTKPTAPKRSKHRDVAADPKANRKKSSQSERRIFSHGS